MSRCVHWLLRVSLVLAPLAMLLAWYFGGAATEIMARLARLHEEFGGETSRSWEHLANLEQSAREAGTEEEARYSHPVPLRALRRRNTRGGRGARKGRTTAPVPEFLPAPATR